MRTGTDHTQKRRRRRRRRRRCVVFSKVFHFSMPVLLFALPKLLGCACCRAMGKRGRARQGTSGALEGQEQEARSEPKGPRGALTRGCAQWYRGQEGTVGGHPWGPPWESRKRPPRGCGPGGPPWWSKSRRHLAQMAERSPVKGPC